MNRIKRFFKKLMTGVHIDYETIMFAGDPTPEVLRIVVEERVAEGWIRVEPRCRCCILAFERTVSTKRMS